MGTTDNNRPTAPRRPGASAPRGGAPAYGQRPGGSAGPTPAGPRNVAPGQGSPYASTGRPAYGAYQPAGSHPGYPSNDEIIRVRKKRKKNKKIVRALLIALAVIVVLVGGVAAYGAWYVSSLASNMAMDAQEQTALDSVMAPVAADAQEDPFYVLLMGSDKWETYGERSDAMILLRVDPTNNQITMVSVPRDTPYMLNGNKVKINQAFAEGGAAGAVTAVQDLTGVKVSYYAEIEFDGLAKFVDSMGGIYVDVPYTIDYQVYTKDQDVVHIEAGNQLLNGTECVALARMRTAYDGQQDAVRQSNVRAMSVALMKNVLQSPPAEIPGLVQSLSECVSTSMDMQEMIRLATGFAQGGSPTIYTCTGPYEGEIDPATGLWLCYENPEGWAALMASVDAGENPETAATTVEGK